MTSYESRSFASLRMTGSLVPLSFSREHDVRRGRRRHMLSARIAQRRQVDPRKERLTTAEQDRRDRDMHLVDEARLEILAHRGRPAADLDIAPARGLPGATERFLNSAGDEMKDGPAFDGDRCARVVRQHEHRHVIRRVLAPPAAPLVVGPRPAYGAEHVSAHDIRTDAFPEALGKIVVGTRRPTRFAVYLAKRARADVPAVQLLTTHAEWVLQPLAGAGAVPVERDREVVDAQFGHGILRWFHMRRMGRPEIDRRRMSWGPDGATRTLLHSAAKAVRGSTCDARRAGIHVARTATRPTNAAAPANVDPSVVLTPYSIDDSTRVNAKAPASPIATPMATTRAPSPSKAPTTLSGVAPSARRTPISRRRCATMSASTPYKPTQANTSARTAKVAMSVMLKRCRASESPTTLSNVRISFSVADELTSCTACRTSGSAASGSPADTRTTSVSANAGNCESGTYTWGGASASNDTVFTSSTTPTMTRGGRSRAHSNSAVTSRPRASASLPKCSRANFRFTIMEARPGSSSEASNTRPATRRMRAAPK